MDKKDVFTKLAESRKALLQAINGLSETEMAQQPVEGEWTVKDILAHINSWELTCLIPLREFAIGGAFKPDVIPDYLVWNDQQAIAWQEKPLPAIIKELTDTRQEILELCEKLTDQQWEMVLPAPWGGEGTLAQMLGGLAWHENEHVESIRNPQPAP